MTINTTNYPIPSVLKGSNLTTVKGVNERLMLSLVRSYGQVTKAEATKITGLSANAVSTIFRSLEQDQMLLRCEPLRGRIGQPSVPMRLNPNARHYIGLKIGRHTFELVLINFTGEVLARRISAHKYPTPSSTLAFIESELPTLLKTADKSMDDISAFNLATPFELWSWTEKIGAPNDEMALWRSFDPVAAIGKIVSCPISVENDGTAACRAQLVFDPPSGIRDFIYFFVGTFIGGGVVLNGSVYPGRYGSAGGFGPVRVPNEQGGDRLIDHASLVVLERMVEKEGGDPLKIYATNTDWNQFGSLVDEWIQRAGRTLAQAIISTLAVIDFEMIVIDGAFPKAIRERLIAEVNQQLEQLDMQGIHRPKIASGSFGSIARALGAASYQISTNYMIDQNTLLHQTQGKK